MEWKKVQKEVKLLYLLCNMFLVMLLLLQTYCSNLANAGSLVKFLPGFKGPLPFELETGYVGVGESEDVQLFYYFIKSESDPENDPLLLWLTGGPGCSAFTGLAYEIGPMNFEPVLYDGSLPKLVLNPNSWTKVASIIFLDQPVGAGFSYARTANASHSFDLQTSDQAYEFLRKWLVDHPEYISNPVYIGGDSYAGFLVPIITQLIANGNEVGIEPKINLQGTYWEIHTQIQALKVNCHGQYQSTDPSNAHCLQHMKTFDQMLSNINTAHILERDCPLASTEPTMENLNGRDISTIEMFPWKVQEPTRIKCRMDGYRLSYHWANDEKVQESLHIRKGTIGEWIRCNYGVSFEQRLTNVVPYHADLSIKGYRSLVYSGDHDYLIPHIGTQAWIKSLNYQIIDDWRQWIVGGQVAGFTRTYANKMTFATVKGGGHTAPEYKPEECLAMFKRWISSQPL